MILTNYKKVTIAILISFCLVLGSAGTNQNFEQSNDIVISATGPTNSLMYEKNIVIDGNIDEWVNPVIKDEFYLDLDNSGNPFNLDGNNYLYVDEDPENLYLAIDLPSDQTNDTNGEWVSLSLNTNASLTDSWGIWADNFNKGTESLVYDVDNNQVWEPFIGSSPTTISLGSTPDASVTAEYGSIVFNPYSNSIADYSRIDLGDPLYDYLVNHTSEPVASEHWSKVDFNFDFTKLNFIGSESSVYTTNEILKLMDNFSLTVRLFHNVSVSSSEVKMWYPDGSNSFSGFSRDILLNTNTSYTSFDIPFDKSMMDDKVFRMSLFTRNDVAFKTTIDQFAIKVDAPVLNGLNLSGYGEYKKVLSSINNFDIGFQFTSSENNASDHRIFEFKIPKSELEGYNSVSDLGIYIGGYGTASFSGSNYWAYDGIDTMPGDFLAYDSRRYHNYTMPLKNPPGDFILTSFVNDHSVDLSWTVSANADNYTLFQSSSPITSITNTLEVVGVFQTATSPITLVLPNGEYYFAVVSSSTTGFTESNQIIVSIDIRTETIIETGPTTTISQPASTTTIYEATVTTVTETTVEYVGTCTCTDYTTTITEVGPNITITETGSTTTITGPTQTDTEISTSVKTESPFPIAPILVGFAILGIFRYRKGV